MMKPTTGDILIQGYSVRKQTKQARQLIGYVPQEIALHTSLSVWDNLNFWAALAPTPVTREKLMEVADQVGLSEHLHRRVAHLSGGYQRRVNMAVAMLHDPPILLMDEPTVGVDIYAKQEMLPFMKAWKDQGRTIIYSSHDAEEIGYLADRVLMLEEGKLVFDGQIAEAQEKLEILQRSPLWNSSTGILDSK